MKLKCCWIVVPSFPQPITKQKKKIYLKPHYNVKLKLNYRKTIVDNLGSICMLEDAVNYYLTRVLHKDQSLI